MHIRSQGKFLGGGICFSISINSSRRKIILVRHQRSNPNHISVFNVHRDWGSIGAIRIDLFTHEFLSFWTLKNHRFLAALSEVYANDRSSLCFMRTVKNDNEMIRASFIRGGV
jgi:hypothetical protein